MNSFEVDKQLKTFIVKDLCIESKELDILPRSLKLLNKICERFQKTIPWQNISLLATGEKPSSLDCVATHIGGTCSTLSVFMKDLLVAAGFKASFAFSRMEEPTGENDHLLVIVWDVEQACSVYAVDVGLPYPYFSAVPLDLRDGEQSGVYFDPYWPLRYVRKGDTYILQNYVKDGIEEFYPKRKQDDGWIDTFFFELKYQNDSEAVEVFKKRHNLTLNKHMVLALWQKRKGVLLVNKRLLLKNDDGSYEISKLRNGEEMKNIILTHFPMIPKWQVEKAVEKFCDFKQFPRQV